MANDQGFTTLPLFDTGDVNGTIVQQSYVPAMRITRHRGEEGTPGYRRDELELFVEMWEDGVITKDFTERVINYFTAGL